MKIIISVLIYSYGQLGRKNGFARIYFEIKKETAYLPSNLDMTEKQIFKEIIIGYRKVIAQRYQYQNLKEIMYSSG